jgi:hypothetical protein
MRSMVLVMTILLVSGILSVWKGYIGLITWVKAKTWLSISKFRLTLGPRLTLTVVILARGKCFFGRSA